MTMIHIAWFLAGVLTGGMHIGMLQQASRPASCGFPWHWFRLPLVGGMLVASALCGGILPMAFGWAIAYFATIAMVAIRPLK